MEGSGQTGGGEPEDAESRPSVDELFARLRSFRASLTDSPAADEGQAITPSDEPDPANQTPSEEENVTDTHMEPTTPETAQTATPEEDEAGRAVRISIPRWAPLAVAVVIAVVIIVFAVSGGGGQSPADKANSLIAAGVRAQTAGQNATAVSDYKAAIVADPKNVGANYDLGTAYQAQGDTRDAISAYNQALKLNPNLVGALYNLAIIYTVPDPQEAVTLYNRAILADPTDPTPHINLGFLLKKLGQTVQGNQQIAIGNQLEHGGAVSQSTTSTTKPKIP